VDALGIAADVLTIHQCLGVMVCAHTANPTVVKFLVVNMAHWAPYVGILFRDQGSWNVDVRGLSPAEVVARPLKLLAELKGECDFLPALLVEERLSARARDPSFPLVVAGGLIESAVETHRVCVTERRCLCAG